MKQHIFPLLASQRRKLGMSQGELAARAGLRREKVNRVESSGQNIGFYELCRLVDALGLELSVAEKEPPNSSLGQSPPVHVGHRLEPQEFHRASFVDGSRAKILRWGKVPR